MIAWLAPGQPFPPVTDALNSPNGLLAASAELSAEHLLLAYSQGIFPWYSEDEPVLWWSPDPRMVLFTDEFRVSRSFAKTLRKVSSESSLHIRLDSAFADVVCGCAAPRDGDDRTWITAGVADAYNELHRRGLAHSIEAWLDRELVGGLYGVALGRMFYGESMFSKATDASKIALAALVQILRIERVPVIDCQQNTRHLASLGAREIPRREFVAHLSTAVHAPAINWSTYTRDSLNALLADLSATD